MALFNSGYPATYPAGYYPSNNQGYQPQQGFNQGYSMAAMPQQTYPQATSGIVWVQGETGARAYMTANGSTVLLMDSESPTFYIKATDASGFPNLRTFDYTERTTNSKALIPSHAEPVETVQQPTIDPNKYATKEEIDHKIDELYKLIDELTASKNSTGRKERNTNG